MLLSAAVVLAGCMNGGAAPTEAPPMVPAPSDARVTFHVDAGDVAVQVEIAATPAARAKGLMYRESLAASAGMVFVFPTEELQSFWMRNTYIPLDMIFLSANKVVVGVVANAEPLTETSRSVNNPSLYVVEVNGGFAQAHGVVAGTRATFANIPESVAR